MAKEGRKYGLGLLVVSQRPSDLSETVLSQCNNFIVLRLSNPRDQEYVRALVSDQYEDIMDMLPALRRGEALILGDSRLMPLRVRIDPFTEESHVPRSQDVSFHGAWVQILIRIVTKLFHAGEDGARIHHPNLHLMGRILYRSM